MLLFLRFSSPLSLVLSSLLLLLFPHKQSFHPRRPLFNLRVVRIGSADAILRAVLIVSLPSDLLHFKGLRLI